MSTVIFTNNIETIIEKTDFSKLGDNIAIKVHFGEKGCDTFIDPSLVRKVYNKITSLGKNAALVECNVLYKGSRTNSTDHIQTAREHGFDMPIDILDGEKGDEYLDINGCKIGKGIEKYDSMVVLSHFKGHVETGFGGAIKNVGMGLGSRAGKLYMHSAIKPSVEANKCTACGICAANCNAEAINLSTGKAIIDLEKCEGCAMCIAMCNFQAIMVPWTGRSSEDVQIKMAEYTAAVLKQIPNTIYINVLKNITKHCDCMGMAQEPIMPDIGILGSDDIVAIDQASYDLANKKSSDAFKNIHPLNYTAQLAEAEKLGLGKREYEIQEII